MIAPCANVANADRHIVGELQLDIDGILLYSWRLSVLIDIADGCANAAQRPFAVTAWLNDAIRKWIIERDSRSRRGLRKYSVLSVSNLPVVVVGCARNRIVGRRPKNSIAAPENRFSVEGIGQTCAWRPLHSRRVALISVIAADTGVHQATGDLPRRRARDGIGRNGDATQAAGGLRVKSHAEVIVLFAQAICVLQPYAVVH